MSYDVWCFRPKAGEPTLEDAHAVVESEETGEPLHPDDGTKDRIAGALLQHNPRLERFQFDYAAIAKSQNISEDEARKHFRHIELNPPEGDIAIQVVISDDHVFVTVPYWYEGAKAAQVFSELSSYLKVIKSASGYFAYDPQKESVFDPETQLLDNFSEYVAVSEQMPLIVAKTLGPKRPWWKFW